ncbi:hypothetical protein QYF36_010104 [Acer negundo]|nr:hypothetical protein QYF36_010104 [Acer negundo]
MWIEACGKKPNIEEPGCKELHYIFQVSPLTSGPSGFFYLRCSNKVGFTVPNTKGKDGDWKREADWKKWDAVNISKEFRKIFQRIKDKKYDPMDRGGDPFN